MRALIRQVFLNRKDSGLGGFHSTRFITKIDAIKLHSAESDNTLILFILIRNEYLEILFLISAAAHQWES